MSNELTPAIVEGMTIAANYGRLIELDSITSNFGSHFNEAAKIALSKRHSPLVSMNGLGLLFAGDTFTSDGLPAAICANC